MYSTAIDSNVLNSLFDNQKKLDDLFDSIFDDDNYFISSPSSSHSESYCSKEAGQSMTSKQSGMKEFLLSIKEQHPYFFVLPLVLEISAIYFVVTNML